MKQSDFKVSEKLVSITRLNAEDALRAHTELMSIVGAAIGDMMSAAGKTDDEQIAAFSNAIMKALSGEGADKIFKYIKTWLTSGHVVFDGQRVNHLNDFDKYEELNGSEILYDVFAKWIELNFVSLIKKLQSLAG